MSLTPPQPPLQERLINLLIKDKPLKEILELIDSENINIDEILLKTKRTLLSTAAYLGRLDLVKALVKRGVKFDEQNIKSALRGKSLDIAIYLLKTNKAEYEKNLDLLIKALPNKTKEEEENVARIKAIRDPEVREQEVINGLVKSGLYIDVSQSRIIRKFQIFLEIQRAKDVRSYPHLEAFIKSFSEGFCNGEVFLWLYKSENGIEEPFWDELKHLLLWNEEEADLEKTNDKGEKWESVYNQMLANILGMFNPGSYYHLPLNQAEFGKIIALHTKSEPIVLDSLFSLLLTEEELRIFLPELMESNLMIGLSNMGHRIGYLKGKFLDPNHPDGVQILDTPDKLIDGICAAFPITQDSCAPIILHRFAKSGSKPSYATKEEEIKAKRYFLNKLYEFREKKALDPINHRSPKGATLLSVASSVGDIETVRWCLEKGANIELEITFKEAELGKEAELETPLAVASNRGMIEVVDLLLKKGANLFPKNSNQPFTLAVVNNKIEVVKLIIEHLRSQDNPNQQPPIPSRVEKLFILKNGFSPLHYSIMQGNMDIFDVLMENGANINLGKISPLMLTVTRGNPDILRRFLKYKNKIDSKELNKAFFSAIKGNKYTMIEELIKSGVPVNLQVLKIAVGLEADNRTLRILAEHQSELPLKEIATNLDRAKILLPKEVLPFYFKRLFTNALKATPPTSYHFFKDFAKEGKDFPSFLDMIPAPEPAGQYLRSALEEFSFEQSEYQVIEFILNNSTFDVNTPMEDPKGKKPPILPLALAIENAIGEYEEEPDKAVEKMEQLVSLWMKKGLNPEQFVTKGVPDPLVECIRKTIAEELAKRPIVASKPVSDKIPKRPPLPRAERPLLPKKPTSVVYSKSLRKNPPLPTTPRPPKKPGPKS